MGQDNREEIDFQLAGSVGGVDFGWQRMEGIECFSPGSGCPTPSLILPILDYYHDEGCSVTGGYRYGGTQSRRSTAPTCSETIAAKHDLGWPCRLPAGRGSVAPRLTGFKIATFGEDEAGELYVVHLGGTVHRFVRIRPRLTVTKAGNGTGTVTGPDGLVCGTK